MLVPHSATRLAASVTLTPHTVEYGVICLQTPFSSPITVLYCTVLYCTVLYCTVLYCTVLYCTVLYCTVLYCTLLYCTVLYYIVLYCNVFRGPTPIVTHNFSTWLYLQLDTPQSGETQETNVCLSVHKYICLFVHKSIHHNCVKGWYVPRLLILVSNCQTNAMPRYTY